MSTLYQNVLNDQLDSGRGYCLGLFSPQLHPEDHLHVELLRNDHYLAHRLYNIFLVYAYSLDAPLE